jgi:hypothetical protein
LATKYQVFISSTYEDLKLERERVTRTVLEMGHIPVGMEMFSAADEEQWKIITRHIDESDYYVVIVAHRYGSVTGGISYTRKEYEYALSRKIPTLGFIIDDNASWPNDRMEKNARSIGKLADFKELVRTKPVATWTNADDLYGKCAVSLVKTFTTQPREGWVRASTTAGPEIVAEITRLSAENAQLRQAAAEAEAAAASSRTAQLEELKRVMRSRKVKANYRYKSGDTSWQYDGRELSLLAIFEAIAPSLQVEYDVNESTALLALYVRRDKNRLVDIVPYNQMQQIYAQLRALELVRPSTRQHSVKDTNEYWSLTDLGQELLNMLTRDRLLGTKAPAPNDEPIISTDDTTSASTENGHHSEADGDESRS